MNDNRKTKSESSSLKNLLKSDEARPFIGKNNTFHADLFSEKFIASFGKLLTLKGLNLELQERSAQTHHHLDINVIPPGSLVKALSWNHKWHGLLFFSPALISEILHKLLGGADHISPQRKEGPPTAMEKRTLEQLDGPLRLALREALTPSLGPIDIEVGKALDPLEIRPFFNHQNFFSEEYCLQGLISSELTLLFKIASFQK